MIKFGKSFDWIRLNIFYFILLGLTLCFLISFGLSGAFAFYYIIVIALLVADEITAKTILKVSRQQFPSFFKSTAFWRVGLLQQFGRFFLSLAAMGLLGFKEEFGLTLQNMNESLWLILSMGLPFAVLFSCGAYVFVKKSQQGKSPIPSTDWMKNSSDRVGTIAYCFSMNGIGEEIFYRGLIQGYLSVNMTGFILLGSFPLMHSTILVMVIFILVHFYTMGETTVEFITMLPYRIIIAFILGITFQLTSSLLAPIVIHNISNGLLVFASILASKTD